MRNLITANNEKEQELIVGLAQRNDTTAQRIKRLLTLPDLLAQPHSPIRIIADVILNLPRFADFDVIHVPKIVTVSDEFDVLNSPKDHPSRKETDTFYLDSVNHLRTQMTVMWPYYLRSEGIREKLEQEGQIMALAPGIVFRKDEIDRKHFPAFHQIDGLLIAKKEKKVITIDDLKEVEVEMTKAIFGDAVDYRFLVDSFPFTDPSVQIEINFNGDWIEVLGSGLVHPQVLKNLGLDPEKYNGWAFGIGLERLAMVKMSIPDIRIFWSADPRITSQFNDINSKYKEVSKYPAVERDISFIIPKSVALNNYYELVRDEGGDLIEQVELIDQYENDEKFGAERKSYTFNIVYRSLEKTLTNEEVNKIHERIAEKTKAEFGAVIR